MNDLQDQVCLVVGGSHGIGRASATLLHQRRARVIVADISSPVPPLDPSIKHLHLDVTDQRSVDQAIRQIHRQEGRIDVLIYCAMRADWRSVQQQSDEAMLATLRIGIEGMFVCTRAVLPIMLKQDCGRLVYVSSILSTIRVLRGCAAYAAVKAATDAWAESLKMDLRDTSIEVSNIRPGLVAGTDFFRNGVSREVLPRLLDYLPSTTPSRIAETIVRSISSSNRTYIVPPIYRILEIGYRLSPSLVRWLCRWGVSRRTDIQCKDELA